jgi:hypothetical protein
MAKNWLDKYDNGGETPANYNSIPTGIVKPPTVIPTSGSSYYEPSEQTIYLNPTAYYKDPSVYQHEMFHHWQNLNDQLRKPDEYQGPLAKPNMLSNNTGDYYNRRTVETDKEYNDFYKDNPTFKVVNPNLIYNGVINPSLYENPKYAEGEAEDYQYYVKGGGRPAFMAKGGLIKRADGSYSRRGLWDNIRANRGSGRKPTAEMLKQERKIKKHEDGSFVEGEDPKTNKVQGNNPLMNIPESVRFPAPVQTTVTYPEGYVNQMFDLKKPVLNTMGKPYATGAVEQSASPLDFIGAGRGIIGLGKGLLKYSKAMKPNYVQIGNDLFNLGPHPKTVNRAVNQMHKGAQQITVAPFANGGWIDMYNEGSWVADSSLPTPTTPSFYDAGEDTTLTNYQMGTDKARMYAAGSTVWTNQDTPLWAAGTPTPTATQNFKNTGSLNTSRYRIGDVIPTGMDYKTPAAGTYDYNKDVQPPKQMVLHAPDTLRMGDGGDIKKHINSPRVYGNPVNPSGMIEGPTTQRGITFGKGGLINMYADAGFVIDGGNDAYEKAKTQYIAASNMGVMGENQMQNLVKQYPQLANDTSLAGYRSVGNAAMFRNNEEANRVETNTLGTVLSTPQSRHVASRQKAVAENPGVYNVEDYKLGIPEPGATNDIMDDPLAMAIIGTATGGVGLGARGATGLGKSLARNLAAEATFGAADLTKGGFNLTKRLFENAPQRIKNLGESFKSTKSLFNEVKGEILHGNKNRKAIQEGNDWFANWVAHPKTQEKIEAGINDRINLHNQYYHSNVKDALDKLNAGDITKEQFDKVFIPNINLNYKSSIDELNLFKDQAKNFKNYSQEYPLANQFKENFLQYFGKGKKNIHLGNAGISESYYRTPFTLDSDPLNIFSMRDKGNWISRKYYGSSKKAGTTIHENTHGWTTRFGMNNAGQTNLVLNNITKEAKDRYLKWKQFGVNAKKEMGATEAFKGYIAHPTEMHARTMELRKAFDLTPDDIVDEEMAKDMMRTMESNRNIITGQSAYLDTFGRDPKKMSNLFNGLWMAAPGAVVVGNGYFQQNNNNMQKQANGGYVKNNNSNTWLEQYN